MNLKYLLFWQASWFPERINFWRASWFPGLVISGVLLIAGWTSSMSALEWQAYGFGASLSSRPDARNSLEIIEIDQKSVDELGKWPWPRSYLGIVIKKLEREGARVIGLALPLHTPQSEFGVRRLDTMRDEYGGKYKDTVKDMLFLARQRLDTDGALANNLKKADNTVLAISYGLGNVTTKGSPSVSREIFNSFAFNDFPDQTSWLSGLLPGVLNAGIAEAAQAQAPIELLARHADAGMLDESVTAGENLVIPLVLKHGEHYFPSFGLEFAALSKHLKTDDIVIQQGEDIRIGDTLIDTDPSYRAYTRLYSAGDNADVFDRHSFYDVYMNNVSETEFSGKDVLIGITAPSLIDELVIAGGGSMPPVLATAHQINSLLQGDTYRIPDWAQSVQLLVFTVVALYLVFLLPRMRFLMGLVTSALFLFILTTYYFGMMVVGDTWIPLMWPIATLACGVLVISTQRLIIEENLRTKEHLYASNLTLAQNLQLQGQLDLAFEKYRQCRLDETLFERLYSLGLDYERRRQFSKAELVYDYIEQHHNDYRDVKQRVKRNREIQDMVVLPKSGKHTDQGTLILTENGLQKPVLGRYEVLKEIGQGAMGKVYLGKDPRIGRTVAIKTLALSQEFDEDELEGIKQRFLREAESAGRLNHQNIVTIYDVGEEQELAYIAMDYLKGQDLSAFRKPDKLLPIDTVIEIAIQVADALAYAHEHNVVHRDIKPANIVYDKTTGVVKVTDFGVARITGSDKTKTGSLLGSPAYMSPEQARGNKVDGCSDLFSLGTMIYELTTGTLPFKAENMAGVMHKVCNEKQRNARRIRADIPECLDLIIDKAMQKNKADRYTNGTEMAMALRQCRSRKRTASKAQKADLGSETKENSKIAVG